MMSVMRFVATSAVVLTLAYGASAQQSAPAQTGPEVVAQVGNRAITMREVDERWAQEDPGDRAEAVQRMYAGRRQALDAMIGDMLIEQAAKAKGLDSVAFTEAELVRRATPVTEQEVSTFFQQNQAQMQGKDLATMGPAIRRYLEEERRSEAHQTLVADLRKAGPPIRMILDPPRQDVEVASDDPSYGGPAAAVTLIEFSDFQCPFCARVEPTLKRLRETYAGRIRIVWKDFPLTSIHPDAFRAAVAGQCAREQTKFWEYHDVLFEHQKALGVESLKQYAVDAGLDAAAFNACLDAAKYEERVQQHIKAGTLLGVSATPSIFINGRLVNGAQPYENFTAIIDEELERAKAK